MDNNLKKLILEEIKPSLKEEKEFEKIVNDLLNILNKAALELSLDVDFLVGGSFGKKTYLKGTFDVDIFTRFSLKYEDSQLSTLTKEILDKANLKYLKQKGSRDYYSGFFGKNKKIYFELVPNFKIKNIEDAKNTTDFSPLHLLFLQEKIKKNPNLTDEIRLAKQYFKSKSLYGAESYINAFSGHTIDLLIVYYQSLENLIKSGKNWGEETIIDINNFYSNPFDIKKYIDKSKQSNLIIVDPIDSQRNASRALNRDNYGKFILTCINQKEFSKKDFQIKKISFEKLISNAKNFEKKSLTTCLIYKLKFNLNDQSQDIVGTKMLKVFEKIEDYFISFDFNIFNSNFHINMNTCECLFIYFLKQKNLNSFKLISGPNVNLTNAVENFILDKQEVFVKNFKVCYYQKRDITNINQISKIDIKKTQTLFSKDLSCLEKIELLD